MIENLTGILIAAALAGLIGLEREMHLQNDNKISFGGFRTFSIIGALGFLASVLEKQFDFAHLTVTILLGTLFFIGIIHAIRIWQTGHLGLTSELSSIGAFLIGILVSEKQVAFAVATSILFTLLLVFKKYLHQVAKNFKKEELLAILKFMILAGVILPILPNEAVDPWGIFNPKVIWTLIVLVASIRFVGFFLSKIMGNQSIVLTGALGGLASSTAVTSSLSLQSKTGKVVAPFVAGILFANALMYVRVFAEVQIIFPELAQSVAVPLFTMAIVAGIIALLAFFVRGKDITQKEQAISQPFSLAEALKFGAFFIAILIAANVIPRYLGDAGLYATGIISGLADTDAITLSMSDLARKGEVAFSTASIVISLAVITNTAIKVLLVAVFGSKRVSVVAGLALFLVMLSGGLALFFV